MEEDDYVRFGERFTPRNEHCQMNYVSANSNKLGRVLGGWTNCKNKKLLSSSISLHRYTTRNIASIILSIVSFERYDEAASFVSITECFHVPTRRRKVFLLLNHQYLVFINVVSLLFIIKHFCGYIQFVCTKHFDIKFNDFS